MRQKVKIQGSLFWGWALCVTLSLPAQAQGALSNWRQHASTLKLAERVTRETLVAPAEISFDEERTQHIAAPLSGRIAQVYVRVGDSVSKDQPLFDIISPQVGELAALLRKAQEDVALARQENSRAKSLLAAGAVSTRDAGQAASSLRKAEAELSQHQAHMASLGLKVSRSGLLASAYARGPGVVVSRSVTSGQEVRAEATESLLTISDLSHLWVVAHVYEDQITGISQGAPVDVAISAFKEETFFATVAQISDVVDPAMRTIRVRANIENNGRHLKPHMYAQMTISRSEQKGIFLPSEAIVMSGEKTFVVQVEDEDQPTAREVKLGPKTDAGYLVRSGLISGDVVVVRGALLLYDALSR